MAPQSKPSKKDKKSKKTSEDEQKRLWEEEQQRRAEIQAQLTSKHNQEQKEHVLRRVLLTESLKQFEILRRKFEKYQKEQNQLKEWNRYINPGETPMVRSSQDIRRYLYKWSIEEDEEQRNSVEKQLLIDERSLLTQDWDRPVLVKKVFMEKYPKRGDKVLRRVRILMEIIDGIGEMLIKEKDLSPIYEMEMKELRHSLKKILFKYLNKWTFDVLSNIEVEMNLLDPITAEYNYASDVVKNYLWTFRNVPLPEEYIKLNAMKMTPLDADFTKSTIIDMKESALRGFWLQFDYLSDESDTFQLPVPPPDEENLLSVLETELQTKKMISDRRIDQMRKARDDWETKQREFLEKQVTSKEKEKLSTPGSTTFRRTTSTSSSRRKSRKSIIEDPNAPPTITDETIVDVSQDFLDHDEEQVVRNREAMGPGSLDLEPLEVNLRSHRITGGVFVFDLAERPRQVRQISQRMIIKMVAEKEELRPKKFFYKYIPPPRPSEFIVVEEGRKRRSLMAPDPSDPLAGFTDARRTTRPSFFYQAPRSSFTSLFVPPKAKKKEDDENVEDIKNQRKLCEITIKLPDYCFWWAEPQICRWEPWEESTHFKSLSPAMQDFNLRRDEIPEKKSNRNLAFAPKRSCNLFSRPKTLKDFDLNDIPPHVHLYYLIVDFILPRMPDDFRFYCELYDEYVKRVKARRAALFFETDIELRVRRLSLFLAEVFADEEDLLGEETESVLSRVALPSPQSSDEKVIEVPDPLKRVVPRVPPTRSPPKTLFPVQKKLRTLLIEPRTSGDWTKVPEKEARRSIVSGISSLVEIVADLEEEPPPKPERVMMFSEFLQRLEALKAQETPLFPTDSQIEAAMRRRGVWVEEEAKKNEETDEISTVDGASEKGDRTPKRRRRGKGPKAVSIHDQHLKDTPGSRARSIRPSSASTMSRRRDSRRKSRRSTKSVRMTLDLESSGKDTEEELDLEEEELELIPHPDGKWTTRDIYFQKYDEEDKRLTFKTGILGTFGLSVFKYGNFPFKSWQLCPSETLPSRIFFTLEAQYVKIEFEISPEGFHFTLLNPPPKKFPPIQHETLELDSLIKLLQNANINLFPDADAFCYIEKTSEKHLAMELHTYLSIGIFAETQTFLWSPYNRFAPRRTALIRGFQVVENVKRAEMLDYMVTPLRTSTVYVEELCEGNSEDMKLKFHYNPPNQSFNPDLYALLKDLMAAQLQRKLRSSDYRLQWNVYSLLKAIRPLSFS